MRSLARALLVGAVACGAGCTFLIDFDEVDGGAEAGSSSGSSGSEGGADRFVPDGPVAFPPPCDPAFPLAQLKCNANFPRPNCASNTTVFPAYPSGQQRAGDLVTCNGGATPTCVQHCPFGCAAMPAGFPDQCDDCNGRPDGTYCVKDLRGPDGRSLGLAIDCEGGKTTKGYVCGEGRCATKCPRTDRSPSCCI